VRQAKGRSNALLLIHPPLAKGCEPPGGPAKLVGALSARGRRCRLWDANLEGQLALMEGASAAVAGAARGKGGGGGSSRPAAGNLAEESVSGGEDAGAWAWRAAGRREEHLAGLRSWNLYGHFDRYRRAVADLNYLLARAAQPYGVRLSLADYEDRRLSPVRSRDLCQAAAAPEANPFYSWFSQRLPAQLSEAPFSHVGFSLNYLSQALTAFAMIGFLRRTAPRLSILIGGGLATSWSRGPGVPAAFGGLVDRWISGPGEEPLLELLGGEEKQDRGLPAFEDLPLKDYLAPGTILPYSAASGCWWRRCSFCPEQAEGNSYRPLEPARVTADLRRLADRWRPALIHLLDNALSPALLKALTASPPGAPWYGFARMTPELKDPAFCRRLRESGCVMLQLGLESGEQRVLDALAKGFSLETAVLALTNLKAAGIATYVYLLFGTPAETLDAARRTLAFTTALAGKIDFLNLAIFNLPAYGAEAQGLATGDFYAGDLSLYRRFTHPQGWHRGEVRRFLAGEFKKEPAAAAILRRDPPYFTSNHAPLLALAASR